MKALLFDPDARRNAFLGFYLEARFGIEVVNASSFEGAKILLAKQSSKFDFIYCDFVKQGRELIRHYLATSSPIHFIVSSDMIIDLSQSQKLKHWVHFVLQADFVNQVTNLIARYFQLELSRTGNQSSLFARIPVSLLPFANPLPGGLYMKKPGTSDHVPVIPAGGQFTDKELDYFQNKKQIESLDIRTETVMAFVEKIQTAIRLKKDPSTQGQIGPGTAPSALTTGLGKSVEEIQKLSAKLGFNAEVREFTKNSVMATIAEVKKAPALSALLQTLSRDKDKYISSHSMLVAHLACGLATKLEWVTDTTFQKLTLAAFLHDISLKNHVLAKISSLKELEYRAQEFTKEEIRAYKNHPMEGAKTAGTFDEVPPDVDTVIAQHHERPNGQGFPRGLSHTRIAPISTVFIVAHDLAQFILDQDSGGNPLSPENLKAFTEANITTYRFSSFRKVLAAVKKLQV